MDRELRALLQAFIRRFGLLSPDRTPCGKDLPIAEAHALMILRGAGAAGELQAHLADQLRVDKSTASRLVARLIAAGRAERAPASGDGREKPVRLTPRGARLAGELDQASAARFAALLGRVPRARRRQVVAAMRDLVAALDELNAHDLEEAA